MKAKYVKLNATAERIEMVLRDGRAPARVVGGKVMPNFVEMLLELEPGTKVSQVKSRIPDIALAVGNPNVRLTQIGERLAVQISRMTREPVYLSKLMPSVPSNSGYATMLGLAEDGAPLMAKLTAPEVSHVLVSGATGSGKTSLAQSMILSLCARYRPHKLGLVLLDPKRREASPFESAIGAHLMMPIARSIEAVMEAMRRVCELMDERVIGAGEPDPRIVIYADEIGDLCQKGGQEMQDLFGRVAMRGRESGMHLLCCTQKPTSKSIGGLLKTNLPLRLVGRMTSVEDARVAAGRAGSGAERLSGSGDFVAVTSEKVIRFQAAVPDLM
jgi:S-DNA-T family DNA segregation ATPase FtsK/SpoIIIE